MKLKLITFAFLIMAYPLVSSASEREGVILANTDYSLTTQELDRLRIAALEGSPDSAHRIVEYFTFTRRDKKASEMWARIGAENGSADSQFVMFQLLSVSKKVDDHRRALFWLAHAAKGGSRHAVSIYETCNALDARYRNPVRSPCFGPESDD